MRVCGCGVAALFFNFKCTHRDAYSCYCVLFNICVFLYDVCVSQDELIAIDCFNGNSDQAFFAVYDGHGGRGAVDFTVRALHLVRAYTVSHFLLWPLGSL